MLIVLNDNEMSISPTVGALSKYLSTIKLSIGLAGQPDRLRPADRARSRSSGKTALELSQRFRRSVVQFAQQPGSLFEDLGISLHRGRSRPRPAGARGHPRTRARLRGPVIVHVRTQKGHGYRPAETDQVGFHGAALPPMTPPTPPAATSTTAAAGARAPARATMPKESMTDDAAPPAAAVATRKAPELHGGLRGRAHRGRPARIGGSWRSPRACPRAPASTASRPSSRTASSTSGSPSPTP